MSQLTNERRYWGSYEPPWLPPNVIWTDAQYASWKLAQDLYVDGDDPLKARPKDQDLETENNVGTVALDQETLDVSEDRPMAFSIDFDEDPQEKAKDLVVESYNREVLIGIDSLLQRSEIRVVWYAKTLQNWKAVLVTTRKDNRLYELTYNWNTGDTYLNTYVKYNSETINDNDR